MDREEILTLDEVALWLKVSRETVRQLCNSGKLAWFAAGVGTNRQAKRIRKSAVDAYIRHERRGSVDRELRNIRATRAALSAVEERW